MQTWNLPEDIPLKKISVTAEQFRFAVGLSRNRAAQLEAGVIVDAPREGTISLNPALALDEMTVTQKQFAEAIGLSPARVNQLVKQGDLVLSPADKRRLMFVGSLEKFCGSRSGNY